LRVVDLLALLDFKSVVARNAETFAGSPGELATLAVGGQGLNGCEVV